MLFFVFVCVMIIELWVVNLFDIIVVCRASLSFFFLLRLVVLSGGLWDDQQRSIVGSADRVAPAVQGHHRVSRAFYFVLSTIFVCV